jgi:hypothetical protein
VRHYGHLRCSLSLGRSSKYNHSITGNAAHQYKIGRYVDFTTAGVAGTGVYGGAGLSTGAQVNTECRPYYSTSGACLFWHDYAVSKLNYLFESLNKIGLVKRLDAQLRFCINTGTGATNAAVGAVDTANLNYTSTPADNTFSATCPLLINYFQSGSSGGSIVPARTKNIAKPPPTNQLPTTNSQFCRNQLSGIYCSTSTTKVSFILCSSDCSSSEIY